MKGGIMDMKKDLRPDPKPEPIDFEPEE